MEQRRRRHLWQRRNEGVEPRRVVPWLPRLVFSDSGKRVWAYTKTGRKLPNGKPEYRYVQGLANRGDDRLRVCRQLAAYDPGEATR